MLSVLRVEMLKWKSAAFRASWSGFKLEFFETVQVFLKAALKYEKFILLFAESKET